MESIDEGAFSLLWKMRFHIGEISGFAIRCKKGNPNTVEPLVGVTEG